mmetsp:Transcript_26201/g.55531  ORF Transcript_26201/g.55531 Transcript_26201/m.55531 type:complete len:161 (+) Transcript_26201:139-621(+)
MPPFFFTLGASPGRNADLGGRSLPGAAPGVSARGGGRELGRAEAVAAAVASAVAPEGPGASGRPPGAGPSGELALPPRGPTALEAPMPGPLAPKAKGGRPPPTPGAPGTAKEALESRPARKFGGCGNGELVPGMPPPIKLGPKVPRPPGAPPQAPQAPPP